LGAASYFGISFDDRLKGDCPHLADLDRIWPQIARSPRIITKVGDLPGDFDVDLKNETSRYTRQAKTPSDLRPEPPLLAVEKLACAANRLALHLVCAGSHLLRMQGFDLRLGLRDGLRRAGGMCAGAA
jgi:hypothetical protein